MLRIDLGNMVFRLVPLNPRDRSDRKFSGKQLLHFTANLRASSYQLIFTPN